ncbi:MAG: hypothetical protein HQP61_07245 [Peptococcaceae bacterium]|nr:hypothetical protein [Candidatus Syntrophopropionicum ammoniitolerans]
MKNAWPETVVLWGAGATKSAGLLTNSDIARALTHILEQPFPGFRLDYSRLFPGVTISDQLKDGFNKLLFKLNGEDKLSRTYDLEALRYIAKSSPKSLNIDTGRKASLNLQELFTLIDQLIDSKLGIETLNDQEEEYFIEQPRINAAKNCLKLLTEELERVAVQGKTQARISNAQFYHDFADALADLMIKEAFEYEKKGYKKDTRDFYLFSYAIVSFNWDPLIIWALFNAQKTRNESPLYMQCGLPLRLFMDLGTTIATRKIDKNNDIILYSANETQAIKINDANYPSRIMRMGKLLYPHGIFGSRQCPQCGKLVISFGHVWDRYSALVFGPSLVTELQQGWHYSEDEENDPGVIRCPFCNQKTYPYDMPLELQTILKKRPIAPLEEIKKEMGLLIKHAKHIIFAGYSMPRDDISEKVFIASSLSGEKIEEKKCTIIEYDPHYSTGQDWLMGTDILDYLRSRKELKPAKAINSILSIFDLNQTKLTLKGIPRIFNSYSSIEQAIIDIFYSGDFPPPRSRI